MCIEHYLDYLDYIDYIDYIDYRDYRDTKLDTGRDNLTQTQTHSNDKKNFFFLLNYFTKDRKNSVIQINYKVKGKRKIQPNKPK